MYIHWTARKIWLQAVCKNKTAFSQMLVIVEWWIKHSSFTFSLKQMCVSFLCEMFWFSERLVMVQCLAFEILLAEEWRWHANAFMLQVCEELWNFYYIYILRNVCLFVCSCNWLGGGGDILLLLLLVGFFSEEGDSAKLVNTCVLCIFVSFIFIFKDCCFSKQ